MKRKQKRRSIKKKKSYIGYKSGCFLIFIIFIPILYGVYLYCQQTDGCAKEKRKEEGNSLIDSIQKIIIVEELEIPHLITPGQEQIIRHTGYTVSYNKNWKLPNWVAYELTRQETYGTEKRSNRFTPDPLVKGTIATNADYARSGYDKGHMAPAADMKWSSKAMSESFYFSNMCPQHPQLNRRAWKELEEQIRDWAVADSAIIIICGPIVNQPAQKIGKNQVYVPEKFFKVVLAPFAQPIRAIGFLFRNKQAIDPLPNYVVTVDSIENLTGLDFFASLPDSIENQVEAYSNYLLWAQ